MVDIYDPRSFWDERFRKHGHTGEVDPVLFAYDQPQRLRAIHHALTRARVSIDTNTKILDIGCGTGDLIEVLMKYGPSSIAAIDISAETINYAKERFGSNPKLRFVTTRVEDMDFPPGSFDLAVGINVLQHIIGNHEFSKAIGNIVRAVRVGGHILVMDFSPLKVENRQPAAYVVFRSRQEYLDVFEGRGCRLTSEFGLPRIGVRLYRTVYRVAAQLARKLSTPKTKNLENRARSEPPSSSRPRFHISHLVEIVLLNLALPFDYLLTPFPPQYTDMRILIFEKK